MIWEMSEISFGVGIQTCLNSTLINLISYFSRSIQRFNMPCHTPCLLHCIECVPFQLCRCYSSSVDDGSDDVTIDIDEELLLPSDLSGKQMPLSILI